MRALLKMYLSKTDELIGYLHNNCLKEQHLNKKTSWKAFEAVSRIVLIFIFILLPFYTFSVPLHYLQYLGSVVIACFIAILGLLFLSRLIEFDKIESYKTEVFVWEKSGNNHAKSRSLIAESFNRKHNRAIRTGELNRIQKYATDGEDLDNNEYLIQDRILEIKFLLYGPLIIVKKGTSPLSKITVLYASLLMSFTIIGISCIFQKRTFEMFEWYVMRGLKKSIQQERMERISKSIEKESDLVLLKRNGDVLEYSDKAKKWLKEKGTEIKNKNKEESEDSKKLTDSEITRQVIESFQNTFGDITKITPSDSTINREVHGL